MWARHASAPPGQNAAKNINRTTGVALTQFPDVRQVAGKCCPGELSFVFIAHYISPGCLHASMKETVLQ